MMSEGATAVNARRELEQGAYLLMVAFINNSERGVWLLLKRTIQIGDSWQNKRRLL